MAKKFYSFLIIAILLNSYLFAQSINVNIIIKPPYSAYLDNYRHLENKAIVTLTNLTASQQQVYLKGSLENETQGLYIRSSADYKPSTPIVLQANQTRVLTADANALRFLDEGNAVTNASEQIKRNIVRTGQLPEGIYKICVRAYDFNTNTPVSMENAGCATLNISLAGPPQITYPLSGQRINTQQRKNINFNWTPPVGNLAGGKIIYDLIVVKVPQGQNPNDAIMAARDFGANNPTIRKQKLNIQSYVRQPFDLEFEPGFTYAVQVIAKDDNNKLVIQNDGKSEIITFTVDPEEKNNNGSGNGNNFTPTAGLGSSPIFMAPTLTGALKYYYHSKGQSSAKPLKNTTAVLVLAYQVQNPSGDINELLPNNIIPGKYDIIATDKTNSTGGFSFNVPDLEKIDFGIKPSYTFVLQRRGDLGNVTVTGKYKRVLRVLVDNSYYCEPEGIHASNEPKDMGTLFCKAKTAVHTVNIKMGTENTPDVSGIPVYILRSVLPKGIPEDEGHPGVSAHEKISVKGKNYYVIAKGETGTNGEVTFDNIFIRNHYNPFDELYIYPKNNDDNTKYSVLDVGVYVLSYANKESYGPDKNKQVDLTSQIIDWSYYYDIASAHYTPIPVYNRRVIFPAPPRIYGTIRNEAASIGNSSNNQGEGGVTLRLYKLTAGQQKFLMGKDPNWASYIASDELGELAVACTGELEREITTSNDGKFDFKDLDIETSGGSKQVGYYRFLSVYKTGFTQKFIPIKPKAPSATGDLDFMKNGEAYAMGNVFIKPNGKLIVNLKDEEKVWVTGKVYYYDPTAKQTGVATKTDKFGKATITAPGGKQKLIVYPDNLDLFMPDTIDVNIPYADSKSDPLTIIVPFKLHRYHIVVRNKENGKPVGGAAVKLLNTNAWLFDDLTSPQLAKEKNDIINEAASKGQGNQNAGKDFYKNKGKDPVAAGKNSATSKETDKYIKYTNTKGGVDFTFKNAAMSFDFLVTSDGQEEYVATIKKVSGNPSKKWKDVYIELTPGRKVTGTVTLDKAPVEQARVRVDLSAASSNLPKIETFTDKAGKFELHNVPITKIGNEVLFTATKSGYVGDKVKDGEIKKVIVEIAGKKQEVIYTAMIGNKVEFRLTTFNDINITRLLGFPVEITSLKEPSGNQKNIKISGIITNIPDNEIFSFKTEQQPINFSALEIEANKNGSKDENGKPYAKPVKLPLVTDRNSVTIRVFDHEGILKRQNGVSIDTAGVAGAMKGSVEISLTSFNVTNFSLNSSDKLYLAERINNKTITEINAFPANATSVYASGKKIRVSNQHGNPLGYKLFSFDASSDIDSSLLTKENLMLHTIINAKITNAKNTAINVPVGTITITKNNIASVKANKGFTIPLDSFRLQADNIQIDNNGLQFGGKLIAAGMQIPYSNAKLLPTSFEIPDKELVAKDIKLLGVKPLKVNGNASFGYEGAKKAWVLSITGENAAAIENLDGFPANTSIPLSSVYLYSNGDYKIGLGTIANSYNLHNIITFTPGSLLVHEKFFEFPGTIELGIPDFKAITTSLMYERSGNNLAPLKIGPGTVEEVKVNGVVIKVDQKDGIALNCSPGKLEMKGAISDEKPEVFNNLRYTLTKKVNEQTQLILDESPKQSMPFGGNKGSSLNITNLTGKMAVSDNKWNYLYIDGDMPESMGFKPDQKRMRFDIKGNMEVNNQSVGISNIETPFGNMNMKFDFANKRLTGTMQMNQDISSGTSVSGAAQIVFDPQGFYFVSGGQLKMQSPEITGLAAILIGNYPTKDPEVTNILTQNSAYFAHFKQLPGSYTSTPDIKGFFFEGSASIPPPYVPTGSIDVGLVSAKLHVIVGGDARMAMNFSKKNIYNMGFALFAEAEFELALSAVVACAGIGVGANAWLDLDGTYESNGNWLVKAQGDVTLEGDTFLGGGVCTSRCTGKLCAAKHKHASMTIGATGQLSNSGSKWDFYFK